MNGNKDMGAPERESLKSLYEAQRAYQQIVVGKLATKDNPELFKYHMCAIVEELGELLKADKRWKTHRNSTYDLAEKMEELADVFITVLNLAIFSGIDAEELFASVITKIQMNVEKLEVEK